MSKQTDYIHTLENERDELMRALEDLCNRVETWEDAVQHIIGRRPDAGLCIKNARSLLELYHNGERP